MNAPFTFANFAAGNFFAADWDQMWAFSNALTNIACTAAGTNSIVLTPLPTSPTVPAYQQFAKFTFVAVATNTGAVNIAVGTLAALQLYDITGVAISAAGTIANGNYYEVIYDSTLNSGAGGFRLLSTAVSTIGYRMVTAAGAVTVLSSDVRILMNKTVGAATTVNGPTSASRSNPLSIKDYKGDAATNNITFNPATGETIDGFTAAQSVTNGVAVISTNYGSKTFYPLTSGGWYIIGAI